jgi:hypothetical protein
MAAAVPFAALGGLALWGLFGAQAHPTVWIARRVAAGAASGGIMGATVVLLAVETRFHGTDRWT